MSVACIPMPHDVAQLIGTNAEAVENRSLLLDKFVFHKSWPVVEEQNRRGRSHIKWDEASRWSFMRIADDASAILRKEANEKKRRASGRNTEPENQERFKAEAKIAESLANVKWDSKELQQVRASHTRNLLSLFRSAYSDKASLTIAQLEGRLAINLADSLIQNAGISLDRLFGLPFIPGSAIKGACRHAALRELKSAHDSERSRLLELFCTIFGTSEADFSKGELKNFSQYYHSKETDRKGAVSFLPAYPVNETRIVVDLTNVHYPEYYKTGLTRELQKENPRPNPFPAVETGAQFAFCLVLNGMISRAEVLSVAEKWLHTAITVNGLGAKTASGYGWFSLKPDLLEELLAAEAKAREADEKRLREAAEAQQKAKEEEARRASLSPEQLAIEALTKLPDDQFAAFAKALAEKTESEQRAFIELIRSNKEKRERWKTWKRRKPEIAQAIESVRALLNLPALP